tara:strand:- start:1615 stop:1728 length:114 start_codon:yes stop_codon:yes gene_type:complete
MERIKEKQQKQTEKTHTKDVDWNDQRELLNGLEIPSI